MKLLFVAYHFPPQGGAGVQRSLKFVKYLPHFGIEPTVLTGLGATDRRWSPPDETLQHEIPDSLKVVRIAWPHGDAGQRRTAEDARLRLAEKLVAEQQLEAIFVSMSPFSDTAFAAALAKRCGLPWIADLRDPWALDEFQVYRTRWHRQRALRSMRAALSSAALVVMNTPEAANALQRAFPEFTGRTISLTNGYDADDLSAPLSSPVRETFNIVHTGFLHTAAGLRQRRRSWEYRLLGRMEPGVEILPRSHYYLLQALEKWRAEAPMIENRVRLILAGDPQPIDRSLVARSSVAAMTTFTGYLPHAESVALVREAELLFMPMHKLPRGRRATIVPGKTYEYMASGRCILAPVPDGDARDFLTSAGTGFVCDPDDVDQIGLHLRHRYDAWCAGRPPPSLNLHALQRFERKHLAEQLANHLHHVVATASGNTSTAKSALISGVA